MRPKALSFDVFGTVVDWRTSIARESRPFLDLLGESDLDVARFADQWRARYVPAMREILEGRRPFVLLDVLHREMLLALLERLDLNVGSLEDRAIDNWAHAWHRLDPWPDAVEGLKRLRTAMPIVAVSNGNVALIVEMARRAGLVWDAVLGGEFSRSFKPDPKVYRDAAAALGVAPGELCHVAAHHSDLAAARAAGLLTAYVARPAEYGGRRRRMPIR